MSFLRREFSLTNVFLRHENLKDFACFENKREQYYKIWRSLWAIYHLIWIILTGLISHYTEGENSAQQIKWFIYLTNWSYLTLTLTTLFDLCSVCRIQRLLQTCRFSSSNSSFKEESSHEDSLPLVTKVTWVFFNISNATALAVTAMYWIFEYDGSQPITAVSISTHVLNSLYVIVNITVCAMPVKILHVIHPILFSLTYIIFTYIYQLCGGRNNTDQPFVYEILDWTDLQHSLLFASIVTFAGVPMCHSIIYGIFISKRLISRSCASGHDIESMGYQREAILQVRNNVECEEKEL